LELLLVEVVAPAVRNDATLAFKAAKLERLEGKRRDLPYKLLFLLQRQGVRLVAEALRQHGSGGKCIWDRETIPC